jgi:hypothetical protein
MLLRRAIKIEENRKQYIQSIISTIYKTAVQTADTTNCTFYKHELNYANKDDNYNNNVFPDCKVTFATHIQDSKSIWHEESTITEALKPFLTPYRKEMITIDWA